MIHALGIFENGKLVYANLGDAWELAQAGTPFLLYENAEEFLARDASVAHAAILVRKPLTNIVSLQGEGRSARIVEICECPVCGDKHIRGTITCDAMAGIRHEESMLG